MFLTSSIWHFIRSSGKKIEWCVNTHAGTLFRLMVRLSHEERHCITDTLKFTSHKVIALIYQLCYMNIVSQSKHAAFYVSSAQIPGVVKEAAVPELVLPSGWRMEETGVGPVKEVQAILCVLGGVAVNHIQQHHDAHRMSHIDQLLQLIWGTVATADRQTRAFIYHFLCKIVESTINPTTINPAIILKPSGSKINHKFTVHDFCVEKVKRGQGIVTLIQTSVRKLNSQSGI